MSLGSQRQNSDAQREQSACSFSGSFGPRNSNGRLSACRVASLTPASAADLPFIILGTMDGNDTIDASNQNTPSSASLRVEGTNVVRVPFGVRRARRRRPERPERWATLVLPFQAGGGSHPTPPQAA